MKIRPRMWGILALLLAFALVASACGDSDSEPGATGDATTTTAEGDGEAPTGGKLLFGAEQEPSNFNVNTADDNLSWGLWVMRNVWPACTRVMPDYNREPFFCEELPSVVSEDPFTVEYKIHPDAEWNDGTPVSSADFEWYYENCNNPEEDDCASTEGYQTATFETVDDKTFRLVWADEPFADYQFLFGNPLPPAHLDLDWTEGFRTDPMIAAGPFMLDEYNPGESLTLVRNESWFGEGPALDELTFVYITEVAGLPPALANGEVDFIYPQPQVDLVDEVDAIDGVVSGIGFGPIWEHITFNTSSGPLGELAVRRAVALGVDRDAIVAALMKPFSEDAVPLGNRILVPQQEGYTDNTPDEFKARDVDAAIAELEGAGWTLGSDGVYEKDGERLSLRIRTTAGNPRREQLQQLLTNQLGEVGIELVVDNKPASEVFPEIFGQDFDIAIFAWVGSPEFAPGVGQLFSSTSGNNPGQYNDPLVDEIAARIVTEVDKADQIASANEADLQMWETLPNVPLYQLPTFLAQRDTIVNLVDNTTNEGPLWNSEAIGVE